MKDSKGLIIFGVIFVVIGAMIVDVPFLSAIFIVAGIIFIIVAVKNGVKNNTDYSQSSSSSATSSSSYQSDHYELSPNSNGYTVKLKLSDLDSNRIYEFGVMITQFFYFGKDTRNVTVFTSNRINTVDDTFAFLAQKKGTRRELNNWVVNIDKNELIKATEYNPSSSEVVNRYFIVVVLVDTVTKEKVIEKYEQLNMNLFNTISDFKQSNQYGVQKFIELGYALSKVDGKYTDKEKKTITEFIKKNSITSDIAELTKFLIMCERNTPRSFDSIILDVKESIGAIRLVTAGMELLVNLSISDGTIEEREKQLLNKFATAFNFSREQYEKMITKSLANNKDIELSLEFFGITENMTTIEKKQKFNKAYAEWNKKIISSNEQTKQMAKKVIEYISQERQKLK